MSDDWEDDGASKESTPDLSNVRYQIVSTSDGQYHGGFFYPSSASRSWIGRGDARYFESLYELSNSQLYLRLHRARKPRIEHADPKYGGGVDLASHAIRLTVDEAQAWLEQEGYHIRLRPERLSLFGPSGKLGPNGLFVAYAEVARQLEKVMADEARGPRWVIWVRTSDPLDPNERPFAFAVARGQKQTVAAGVESLNMRFGRSKYPPAFSMEAWATMSPAEKAFARLSLAETISSGADGERRNWHNACRAVWGEKMETSLPDLDEAVRSSAIPAPPPLAELTQLTEATPATSALTSEQRIMLAIGLLQKEPNRSQNSIAAEVGIASSTLSRSDLWRKALAASQGDLPRGIRHDDGDLEAFDDE